MTTKDICVLLSRKQPKYPVLFLTEMGTLMRSDPRSNSPEASIHFAKAHSLQGLVCPSAFLLRNPAVVEQIKKVHLSSFSFSVPSFVSFLFLFLPTKSIIVQLILSHKPLIVPPSIIHLFVVMFSPPSSSPLPSPSLSFTHIP